MTIGTVKLGQRPLALGAAQWGLRYGIANTGGPPSPEELRHMLEDAASFGTTTIDTAREYGDSEARIGELASADSWRIVTKLAATLGPVEATPGDLIRAAGVSLRASRLALRRDSLDVLLLHRADHKSVAGGAVWQYLRDIAASGTIGSLGISARNPVEAWDALEDPQVEAIQVATSLLDQRLSRNGFFSEARIRGVEIFVRSTFLQGVGHILPEQLPDHLAELREPLQQIRTFASDRGWRPYTPFLAFFGTLPDATPVVGTESRAQLAEVHAAWQEGQGATNEIAELAMRVPNLSADVLDPSLWPKGIGT